MAEIGLAAAQTLFAALQVFEVKNKCSIWNYKSQLQELNSAVKKIKEVLKDAESKELTKEQQSYIEDLKDAVYDADDLFDEFATRLNQGSECDEFFQKVRHFFSFSQAYKTFQRVKKIQMKLYSIVEIHNKFKLLGVDDKPISMRREETCSYVDVKDIIGRDGDKKDIIDELLRSKNEDVHFLTIVGVGGIGKTALAKLVYNDEKVKQEFGNSVYWVCVSDQDQRELDVKAILCKILEVVTHENLFDASSLETIQEKFQENLGGKKYLLVLDDVWNESREEWVNLEKLLKLGQKGSRVLVTTRSEITATIIGDGCNYRWLQGLSPENSRRLFEMTAFCQGHHQQMEFIELGNKIVEKCYNNPLAIKVVGSLLYGQDIQKWKSFEKSGLAKIENSMGDNKIMSVLKLSYHNLRYSLKCCFTYCAVFPKDYVLERRKLISLWMAQGYIVRSDEGQSIEDAAEEHFLILLRRCFFQDVIRDEYGDVVSVKIHDLMHDVAQEVGGGEIQVLSSGGKNIGSRTRHVSVFDEECLESSSNWTRFRSVIMLCDSWTRRSVISLEEARVRNWKSVRVLDLKYVDGVHGGSSLESIGKLHHLRYLDLSGCPCEELPSSITELHNLETLILFDCRKLKQLPHGFSKLVKLSHLDVGGCSEICSMPLDGDTLTRVRMRECTDLICMPSGMDKLTKLRVLPNFVVGKKKIAKKQCDDELRVLETLTNLTGRIKIDIGKNYRNAEVEEEMSGGYLSKIPGLKEVQIDFCVESVEAEALMEKLQPHPNVKGLYLWGYQGRTIPRWGRAEDNWAISLPNLVTIQISNCQKLMNLPSFSKLRHLKSLELYELENLEYMEKTSSASSSAQATDTTFFPSLVSLVIYECTMLKGWFWEEGLADADCGWRLRFRCRFPCLSTLEITDCPNLRSFPSCSSVKDMTLFGVNKTSQLMKHMMGKEEQREVTVGNGSSSSSSTLSSSSCCLATLHIRYDDEMESLAEFEDVLEMCASLRELEISHCNRLTRFSRGLQHLTALESLILEHNDQLNFSEDDNEDMMQWKPLHQSLDCLVFRLLPNMTSLPQGMQYLTSLRALILQECNQLEGLPEWISCLSSLQDLYINFCPAVESVTEVIQNLTSLKELNIWLCEGYRLLERFRQFDGENLLNLQHIPKRNFLIW